VAETKTVWDPFVRLLHWSLVAGVAVAWLTEDGPDILHDGAGYPVIIAVGLRLAWGLFGPDHARFTTFIRGPSVTLDYANAIRKGTEPRHLGHNPLGGWMILALLGSADAAGITGWLYTTDLFWGVEWMEELHEFSAQLLLVCIVLHVAGVVFTSVRQHENLAAAMVHGEKETRPGDQP
jgi:cytochrome b